MSMTFWSQENRALDAYKDLFYGANQANKRVIQHLQCLAALSFQQKSTLAFFQAACFNSFARMYLCTEHSYFFFEYITQKGVVGATGSLFGAARGL